MAKDPAFLFYPGDYLRDTQNFTEGQQVAYDRIMCEHMRNICITQIQLDFFTKRISSAEKAELMFYLKQVNGGYQIEWVAESIIKRRAYTESRRNNKVKKGKTVCLTYDNHMENENENIYNDSAFAQFWEAYPKKRSKGQAERAFKKLNPDESLLKTILEKIELLKLTDDWKKDKGQFIPYPATWLNAKGWEDEIETGKKSRWG